MHHVPILIFAAILLPVLLYFEKTGSKKGLVPTKTALSLLFIITAAVQPHPAPQYYQRLLAGLTLCLMGDVFLALPHKRMFLFGLLSFLAGHVMYVLAFLPLAVHGVPLWGATLVFACAGTVVFRWLRPHLGTMKGPVLFYVIVITAMVSCASGVLGNPRLTFAGRWLVFAGAVLFYFSDVFVARDRFVKKSFSNRLAGLPLYYGGQFLLAFSIGAVSL